MNPIIACLLALILFLSEGIAAASTAVPGWKTVVKDDIHWIRSPEGRLFYSKGVNIVTGFKETEKSRCKQAFYWGNFHSSMESWQHEVSARLRNWGFNTRGGWSDPSPNIDLALTVDLELGRHSSYHWFDPFDPTMEQAVLEKARELTAPYRNDPRLLGYYTDNEVGWWNSPLFEWYLKKDWDNHTKRVLWQIIHDHYAGQWDRLLTDWVPQGSLSSFEGLKQGDSALKLRPGGEGIHLIDRFLQRCAGHYYRTMANALRQAHPGALILGDRLPLYYHQDAVLSMGDNVDILSTNYNVDVADGWVAPYYFDGLRHLTKKPVLVTEFFFAAQENRSGNRNQTAGNAHPKPGHLMTVATQAERAWGLSNALHNFARFPNIVGAHWFQYSDEPLGGREDGEDYNMGLIDTSNRPYEEVTQAFKAINPVMEELHRESAAHEAANYMPAPKVLPTARSAVDSRRTDIVRAATPIHVGDQSLLDWDKSSSRLLGFHVPKPYVPFGDVHMAWAPEGLYLASMANTYVDPRLLAYEGDFPLSETFQIHLTVGVSQKTHRFSIYLVPRPNPQFADGFDIQPQLYRQMDGRPEEPMPATGRIQRIDKSLPHMVLEGFIPAEWLGLDELRPGMELGMNITMTSYYRELTMSWAGDLEKPGSTGFLRTVVLKDAEGKSVARAPSSE